MKDVSTQDVHYKNNKIALKVLNYKKKNIDFKGVQYDK